MYNILLIKLIKYVKIHFEKFLYMQLFKDNFLYKNMEELRIIKYA